MHMLFENYFAYTEYTSFLNQELLLKICFFSSLGGLMNVPYKQLSFSTTWKRSDNFIYVSLVQGLFSEPPIIFTWTAETLWLSKFTLYSLSSPRKLEHLQGKAIWGHYFFSHKVKTTGVMYWLVFLYKLVRPYQILLQG